MQSYGTNEPRGLMGGGGSVWVPLHQPCQSQTWWVKGDMWTLGPSTHTPTNPTHPTNHPSIHPTHQPFPNPPLGPNNPCPIPPPTPPTHPPIHPPIHLSTHPPIQPSTNLPTHPATHPCALTTPPTLNTSISCQMSSHITAQHPFRIQN